MLIKFGAAVKEWLWFRTQCNQHLNTARNRCFCFCFFNVQKKLQPSFRKTGASYNMKSSYGLRCSLSSSLVSCGIYCIWWQSLHGINSAGWRRDAEVSHLTSPYGANYWFWKSIQPLNCARSAKSKRNKHIHQPTWREKKMRKKRSRCSGRLCEERWGISDCCPQLTSHCVTITGLVGKKSCKITWVMLQVPLNLRFHWLMDMDIFYA